MAPTTLLTLPGEIRNQIYREVLVYDAIEVQGIPSPFKSPRRSIFFLGPPPSEKDAFHRVMFARDLLALLLVSRQIFNEALPIFLGENRFYIIYHDFLHHFVTGNGAKRMAMLSDVTLYIEEEDAFDEDGERKPIEAPLDPKAVFHNWPDLKVFLGHTLKLRLWYWDGWEGDAEYFWEELVRMGILDLEGQVEFLAVYTWLVDPDTMEECASIWKCERGSKIQMVARDKVMPARELESYFPCINTLPYD
ncbi:MAG: hypothetical protein Q9203_005933 [Teloschistes exilis]